MIKISFQIGREKKSTKKTGCGRTVNQTANRFTGWNFPIKEIYQKLEYHKPLDIASLQPDPPQKPERLNITRREGFLYIDMDTPLEVYKNAAV